MAKSALLLRLGVSLVAVMVPVSMAAFAAASIASEHEQRAVLIAVTIALILCIAWWSLVLIAWGEDLWFWTSHRRHRI